MTKKDRRLKSDVREMCRLMDGIANDVVYLRGAVTRIRERVTELAAATQQTENSVARIGRVQDAHSIMLQTILNTLQNRDPDQDPEP